MKYTTAHWTVIKIFVITAMLSLFPLYGYTGPLPDGGRRGTVENLSVNKSEKFELVDKGDYYYLNTGEKVSFLRRKNTYLTIFDKNKIKASQPQKLLLRARRGRMKAFMALPVTPRLLLPIAPPTPATAVP